MWTANKQDLVHNCDNCVTSLTVLTRIALTISRRSLYGTPHYGVNALCPFKQRVPGVLPPSLSPSLSYSQDSRKSTQSFCRIGQSGVKKDVRIAFPRFNPQRAAGSFPSERTDQQKRHFRHLQQWAGERKCEERLRLIEVLWRSAR